MLNYIKMYNEVAQCVISIKTLAVFIVSISSLRFFFLRSKKGGKNSVKVQTAPVHRKLRRQSFRINVNPSKLEDYVTPTLALTNYTPPPPTAPLQTFRTHPYYSFTVVIKDMSFLLSVARKNVSAKQAKWISDIQRRTDSGERL